MSFDPTNPKNNESPGLFPAENHRNMTRLQTLFGEDHQFNDTAATNDGWHNVIHWIQQGSNPIDPTDPSAAAPDNTGGPPISWENVDTYGVARVWNRQANFGKVRAMDGWNEIQVNNFEVTATLSELFQTSTGDSLPPDGTYGEIYCLGTSLFGFSRGFFYKSGGILYSSAYPQQNARASAALGTVTFGYNLILPQPYIQVQLGSGSTPFIANFRILYRYF